MQVILIEILDEASLALKLTVHAVIEFREELRDLRDREDVHASPDPARYQGLVGSDRFGVGDAYIVLLRLGLLH